MVGTIVSSVVAFSRAHQELAYALILAVALSESLPVLGAFVPGDAVILGVSALVPTGALELWPLMVAVSLGAVIGDGLSFWLGHRYRRTVLARWPLRRYPALVARGESFLARHGGKSVLIARFTPGVRAVVPLLAGILEMPVTRFYAMNLLSALAWGPAHVLAGVAIGATLVLLGAVAGRLAFIAALLLVLIALVVWATRFALRHLPNLAARAGARLRRWALRRDGWLARALLSVLEPTRRELPGLALLGGVLGAALWLFFGVLQDVLAGDPLVRANAAVFHFLQSLRTDWIDRVMIGVTELGDLTVVVAVTFAGLLWLAWRRNWRASAHLAATVALASLFTLLMKSTLQVPRPYTLGSEWSLSAFPSGHSAVNAALYGFIAIGASWELGARGKLLVTSAVALFVVAIAFARLYLGAHWLSDVLAGLGFGVAWAALLGIAYFSRSSPPLGAGGLCASCGATLLVVGAVHIDQWHARDTVRYAAHERIVVLARSRWWQTRWAALPARRIDLAGEREAPLTFQWAGTAQALRAELAASGWHAPRGWTTRSLLAWLKPHVRLRSLPVLPQLENGHEPVLVLVRRPAPGPGRVRVVLRMWRSHFAVAAGRGAPVPILVGAVSEQRLARPVWFLSTTRTLSDYDAPRDALSVQLPVHRLVERGGGIAGHGWDGAVLLGAPARPHGARMNAGGRG
jgi:membrane protein DedA with SNARE-associated domain